MRGTTLEAEREVANFAAAAACHFKDNPQSATFGDDFPSPGCYLALRWGLGDDCVLVVKLDADFEAVNFHGAIR